MKRSGSCKLLSTTLKAMLEVRWDSIADMLEAFCSVFDEIYELYRKKGELQKLSGWDGDLMTQLLDLLLHFRNVTKELQARKVPTLHLVLIRYHDLLGYCTPTEERKETLHKDIVAVMSRAKTYLEMKVALSDEHFAATFLCPNVRALKNVKEEDRERANNAVKKIYNDVAAFLQDSPERDVVDDSPSTSATQDAQPPPAKRARFEGWDQQEEDTLTLEEEIRMYRVYLINT